MILAILATQTLGYGFADALKIENRALIYIASALAAVLIALSAAFVAANLPTRGLTNCTQAQFLVFDLALFIGGAGLLAFVLANSNGRDFDRGARVPIRCGVRQRLLWSVSWTVGRYCDPSLRDTKAVKGERG
jgi:hypothetical protein